MSRKRVGELSFNTQPPEGGWAGYRVPSVARPCFNTQPPEGGWTDDPKSGDIAMWFQHTAARRRLGPRNIYQAGCMSFNTQPPEGGWGVAPTLAA